MPLRSAQRNQSLQGMSGSLYHHVLSCNLAPCGKADKLLLRSSKKKIYRMGKKRGGNSRTKDEELTFPPKRLMEIYTTDSKGIRGWMEESHRNIHCIFSSADQKH